MRGGAKLINVTFGPGSQSDPAIGGLYHFLLVLMPVDVVGTVIDILYTCICVYGNSGTMANAGERLMLAVFNYDDYIITFFSSVAI